MSMQRGFAPRWWTLTVAGIGLLVTSRAFALDKQGSAHGGDVSADTSGFGFSGNLALGASLYRDCAAGPRLLHPVANCRTVGPSLRVRSPDCAALTRVRQTEAPTARH